MKNIFKNRIPKTAGWLIPGLEIKRWFALIFFGVLLIIAGILTLSDPVQVYHYLIDIKTSVNADVVAAIAIVLGAICFFKGWQRTNLSMLDIHSEKEKENVLETLYKRKKLNKGPRVVAIGGGTGLSMLLRGLKKITNNITAIVTVGDDGGSSGRLREEMGVLPPGDIRNCIAALADDEDLFTKLFQYRFDMGEGLKGHSFGNLFLTALCAITGNLVGAIKESSNVLCIRGRVLPATLDDMKLAAEMEDGRIIHGESSIPEAKGKIKRLFTEPADCKALPEALDAIKNADLIVMGPGSLYTSVIPNLLVKEIAQAVAKAKAKKIYVCNIMTQPGETDNYSVSSHVNAILTHAGSKDVLDAVLVNNNIPKNISPAYAKHNSFPVVLDNENLTPTGVKLVSANLLEEDKCKDGLVRHSSSRVARAVYIWYRKTIKKEQRKRWFRRLFGKNKNNK